MSLKIAFNFNSPKNATRSPYNRNMGQRRRALTDRELCDLYNLKPCLVRIRPLDEKTLQAYLRPGYRLEQSANDVVRSRRALIDEYDRTVNLKRKEPDSSPEHSVSPVTISASSVVSNYRYTMPGRVSVHDTPSKRCIIS